jgi:hypothetical protein
VGDWLLNLPIPLMAIVIFAAIYLVTAAIYFIVTGLAIDDRAQAFKAFSPGMLPPLGIIFGLLVGFVAVQVWNDFDKAKAAIASEASARRRDRCSSGKLSARRTTPRSGASVARCSAIAGHSEMGCDPPPGALRLDRNRHGPQRQSNDMRHRLDDLCHRRRNLCANDRSLYSSVQRRDFRWTRSLAAGHNQREREWNG